ncbi:hypothetical protein P9597_17475 [Aneurinibacillus migulanus]|uniref:hypothetical protein n=1 Tax=Aneurinibacillus migulanus TaxID=47500 RepID=UPI002E1FEF9A|nr:hypothetical protein [Aneurinibacillus migulanus]
MEKEEGGYALRPGRKKADVSFSDCSRPPPFLLFFPLTTRICRFIKSDVYILTFYFESLEKEVFSHVYKSK